MKEYKEAMQNFLTGDRIRYQRDFQIDQLLK